MYYYWGQALAGPPLAKWLLIFAFNLSDLQQDSLTCCQIKCFQAEVIRLLMPFPREIIPANLDWRLQWDQQWIWRDEGKACLIWALQSWLFFSFCCNLLNLGVTDRQRVTVPEGSADPAHKQIDGLLITEMSLQPRRSDETPNKLTP